MYPPDIVVKQGVPTCFQAVLHLRLYLRVLDVVGPVEVAQVEVARVALAHPLGLQDKPLALRVHDVQRSLFIVKAVGKGLVDGVVHILGIEGPDGLAVPLYGAFDGVGPGAHVVHIGLGDLHPQHRATGREVQALLREGLPGVGDTLGPAGQNQRHL